MEAVPEREPLAADDVVVVVDDDASVRRALSRLVRSAGLAVETYPSAEAFLDTPAAGRSGCLVLDLRMPSTNGLELQHELRRRGRDLPVIFLTGYGDVPSTVAAMKAGATEFLEKPVDDERFLAAVGEALERGRRTRAERVEREALDERLDTLTTRERQVFELVVTGLLNKQVGARLGVSEKTVKVHRGRLMEKMQAGSLAELVRMAGKLGLDSE